MALIPPALIFVNFDINGLNKSTLVSQLMINDSIDKTEFDARLMADPSYVDQIHLNNLRVLVTISDFSDPTNNIADVIIFLKNGLANVLKNNFGPPRQSWPIGRLNVYELLRANNSSFVTILPQNPPKPCGCIILCQCGIGGILAEELIDQSGVHCANPDNEYNNPDFINRK